MHCKIQPMILYLSMNPFMRWYAKISTSVKSHFSSIWLLTTQTCFALFFNSLSSIFLVFLFVSTLDTALMMLVVVLYQGLCQHWHWFDQSGHKECNHAQLGLELPRFICIINYWLKSHCKLNHHLCHLMLLMCCHYSYCWYLLHQMGAIKNHPEAHVGQCATWHQKKFKNWSTKGLTNQTYW